MPGKKSILCFSNPLKIISVKIRDDVESLIELALLHSQVKN